MRNRPAELTGIESAFVPGSIEQVQAFVRCAAMSQVIATAAELDLPRMLVERRWRIADLARSLDCDDDALLRLLRALASIGWCTIGDDTTVEAAAGFSADDARACRPLALWWGRYRWPIWCDLLYSIRTGRTAIGNGSGSIGMHELEQDSAAARIFHGAMASVTHRVAEAMLQRCDLSFARHIVDVGGGHGELLSAVLRAHPAARGVLFDLPHARDGAAAHLHETGVLDRCEIVSGNFFDAVPAADTYLLKSILHDWSDDDSQRILQRCRDACERGACLIVIEQILPERIEPCVAHQRATISDLNMLVMLGGRERTLDEHRRLLAKAGFALETVHDAVLGFAVLESRREPGSS